MGNAHVDPHLEELAAKNHVSIEEVNALTAAFHAGNKKGKPVHLKKFKKILAEVHKLHDNDNFSHDAAEAIFRVLDPDNSGTVDSEHFISGVTVLTSGSDDEKAELVFKAINRSHSGKMTKAEFKHYAHRILGM